LALVLARILAGLVLAPAAAAASFDSAGRHGTVEFDAGPAVHGYRVHVAATEFKRTQAGTVTITLTRRSGASMQSHQWLFTGRSAPRVDISLTRATVKGDFGPFGKLNIRIRGTGKTRHTALVPPSSAYSACTSAGRQAERAARVTGTLSLHLDQGLFRGVRARGFSGGRAIDTPRYRCKPVPADRAGTAVTLAGGDFSAFQLKPGGSVTESVRVERRQDTPTAPSTDDGKVQSVHTISVGGLPASALRRAGDLSSATVRAGGAWLSGSVRYTAHTPPGDQSTQGIGAGDFAAHFDSLGTLDPLDTAVQLSLRDETYVAPAKPAGVQWHATDLTGTTAAHDLGFDNDTVYAAGQTATSQTWDFGDGTHATIAGAAPHTTHTYATYGSYDVTLTVTLPDGQLASKTRTVESPDVPPQPAWIDTSASAHAGDEIAFAGFVDDPDSTTFTWLWSFGDGTTSNVMNPTHLYPDAGTYLVSLRVTDEGGAGGMTTMPVTIAP
jgi:hypothetical protein